jgi:Domain of unknown function (DUF1611_C) P-loop domain/X-Pro dipeptidyl-peptidase (S15 family)
LNAVRTPRSNSHRMGEGFPEFERLLTRGDAGSSPLFGVAEIKCETVFVPMRDGTRLATDLYLPPARPAPTVAMRTPYGRNMDRSGEHKLAAAVSHTEIERLIEAETMATGYFNEPLPEQALAPYLAAARLTNPKARFAGVSLNTSRLSEAEAQVILRNTRQSMGLPCVDPIRTGVESIVAALETFDAR